MQPSATLRTRGFWMCLLVACCPQVSEAVDRSSSSQRPPNILFLLADDQRWDTLGCMGNKVVQTPHIDRLAAQGTRFSNAFVTASVCSVSRTAILTGVYPCCRGVGDLVALVTPECPNATYPAVLRRGGYETGSIGKWDVGAGEEGFRMGMSLFDFWGGDRLHGNQWHEQDCQVITNDGRAAKTTIKCTCSPNGSTPRTGSAGLSHPVHFDRDIVPLKVRQFLAGRDTTKPFFLSVSFRGPKDPWSDYPEDVASLYASTSMPIPATATEADANSQPAFLRASLASDRGRSLVGNREALAEQIRNYYRMVTTIDGTVGRLRELLADNGLESNTIIVFTSDNGHFLGEHGFWGKWLPHDESIRVPLVVYDPRGSASAHGLECRELVLNIDFAPTILTWAGLPVPKELQGQSLTPLVEGQRVSWRKAFYHEFTWTYDGRIAPSEGLRTARWKYISYFSQQPIVEQLFDLESDPGETIDLSSRPEYVDLLNVMRTGVERNRELLRGR